MAIKATLSTTYVDAPEDVYNAKAYAEKAAASQDAAKTSETNAASSAAAAKTSETNAKASETKSLASATNAKVSETNAKASETNAKDSEDAAAASAKMAALSQTAAKTSETNAQTYAEQLESVLAALNTKDERLVIGSATQPTDGSHWIEPTSDKSWTLAASKIVASHEKPDDAHAVWIEALE